MPTLRSLVHPIGDAEEDVRIKIIDDEELSTWAKKLRITPEHLKEVVYRVGPRVRDVRQEMYRSH